MGKVIEVNNLSFGYDGRLTIKDVSFSVDKGDFVGIIGPNGSGKSTLVKLLLGILRPSGGQIRILGENIEKFNCWDKIGYVSQKANAYNTAFPATVEEVVSANLFSRIGLFKPIGRKHRDVVYNALKLVGMQDYGKSLIGNLSGGQQQRVFIARVLVSEPEIMFLDEPTVGIDVKSEEELYCMLARLNNELGITIMMVTHDISAVTVHANKLACMADKGLVMHDPKEEDAKKYISQLYGYEVNLHIHQHNCDNVMKGDEDNV
ncbi:zinc ABC transporter ATP-binding protein [Clostridium thermosuccinogenes]|uniref:Zinc ABC transporter ATP-binding protein n=1 Tax=Clostridium thermosuccinogenes TaxID=84032 RepID=A0A2K2FNU5_9CLOT|nr:ABC transporter ATP-binding protein [Pseudoclostridium thermosuccinogenes]AUS95826.1 zinc ABC transporter ATP-binding protein [Pseudoclostridium thermosuccinogenes]PNT98349.1 zinc ABC transporter ATP-binding protein [Pseudoclostridium thermosuccinogenes]PNU00450.1 zinc ABC transporter ATP-binding protein [Pseudoclostridium thermosuccinogenes]